MVHRDHVLAARLRPADRAPGAAREPADDEVLHRESLGAEPAPDIRADDPDVGWVEPEHQRQPVAVLVGRLGREPRGQPTVRAHSRAVRARLQRYGGHALAGERPGHDDLAPGQDIGPLLGGAGAADVRADVRVQQNPVLDRLTRIRDDRQLLVVDHDEVGGVGGRVLALGEDRGDDVAGEADRVAREDRPVHPLVDSQERRRAERPQVDVGGGEHLHPRQLQRLGDVDVGDPRVRVRGSDEGEDEIVRQRHVVHVAPRATQEA